jgi:hypothetical protein
VAEKSRDLSSSDTATPGSSVTTEFDRFCPFPSPAVGKGRASRLLMRPSVPVARALSLTRRRVARSGRPFTAPIISCRLDLA